MKYLSLFGFILLLNVLCSPVHADEVMLDSAPVQINIRAPYSTIEARKVNSAENQGMAESKGTDLYRDPYQKKSTSYKKEGNFKDFSYGTQYDTSILPDEISQTNKMYTKYKKKNFEIESAYKTKSLNSTIDDKKKGDISVAPQYKINDKIKFKNVYTTSLMEKSQKNQVVLNLKPFKDDRMDLDLGAAQVYPQDNSPVRSQIDFAAKYRF